MSGSGLFRNAELFCLYIDCDGAGAAKIRSGNGAQANPATADHRDGIFSIYSAAGNGVKAHSEGLNYAEFGQGQIGWKNLFSRYLDKFREASVALHAHCLVELTCVRAISTA